MQSVAREQFAGWLAIATFPDQRVPNVGQMNPNLVGTPCRDYASDRTESNGPRETTSVRNGVFAVFADNLFRAGLVGANRRRDALVFERNPTVTECKVLLAHARRGHLALNKFDQVCTQHKEIHTRCVFVQLVNSPNLALQLLAEQPLYAVFVLECATGRGNSRRFVDDDEL